VLRVLVLTSRYPDKVRPGAGGFVEQQTLALAALSGTTVEVVAPIAIPPFPLSLRSLHSRLAMLPGEEMWNGLRVHRPRYRYVPAFPELGPASMARRLLPLLHDIRRRFEFDVIAAQFFWPEAPAAAHLAFALQVPLSIKGRGPDVLMWTGRKRPLRMMREAARAADGLLSVSRSLRRDMIALGIGDDRIEVHYTGLDRNLFIPQDRIAAKAALGISGPLLLSAGNLVSRKGHLLVLDTLKHLEGVTLMIAGDGPEGERIHQRAIDLGVGDRVVFLRMVAQADLPALYAAADLTVHAASLEGFANVRVESLACGTPVVTTAAGGADELIDRPAAGAIVPADAEAMANAIRDILDRPPPQETVTPSAERFSWEANASQLRDHLAALVRSRRASGQNPTLDALV